METKFDKTLEILFELKISDVMQKNIITMSPDDEMSDLRTTLREAGISGVPVVKDNELVGIISIEDLIRWLSNGGVKSTIGEKMQKEPQCIYSDQPLIQAVKRFDQLGFGRFPVLDRDTNKLVGIITKGDIIESTLQKLENEYKEEEIRQYRASHIFQDITADYKEIFLKFNIMGKDFDKAGKASTTLKKDLKRLGIRPDIIQRVAIASYEAEMNVVIYTDGGTMSYRITKDKVSIEVKDLGPGIEDVEKAMQPGYTTSEPWVKELGFGAGMGLSNIKKCADSMEIKSFPGSGTTIKIIILTGESK
jgi:CBS domain-containing protein/anti-sigma regulatory factor (Ser/Thr protein kinase)